MKVAFYLFIIVFSIVIPIISALQKAKKKREPAKPSFSPQIPDLSESDPYSFASTLASGAASEAASEAVSDAASGRKIETLPEREGQRVTLASESAIKPAGDSETAPSPAEGFSVEKAVIYSEILKPKFDEFC